MKDYTSKQVANILTCPFFIFPHIPVYLQILHTLCVSPFLSPIISLHTPGSGFCPGSAHALPLQKQMHIWHFFPSRYMVCNLIFHMACSPPAAGLRFHVPSGVFRYTGFLQMYPSSRMLICLRPIQFLVNKFQLPSQIQIIPA